jgi:hypothetical protein
MKHTEFPTSIPTQAADLISPVSSFWRFRARGFSDAKQYGPGINLAGLRPRYRRSKEAAMKIRVLIMGSLCLLAAFAAHAATRTAVSSSESDVAAAVATASNGDTVQIPCSPSSSTWTTTLTIPKSITITGMGASPNIGPSTFGSGTNCVTIKDGNGSGPIFNLAPTYDATNNLTVLQNLNIDPAGASAALTSPVYIIGAATASGFPQIRVNNVIFGNGIQWTESGNSSNASWLIVLDDVIGVLDHITMPNGTSADLYSDNFSSYLGVGQYGDNSWAQPDSFGGANNLFTENNLVYIGSLAYNECEVSDHYEDIGGCRIVNRFNHVISTGGFFLTGGHGVDTTGRSRSIRHSETYKNTVLCNSGSGCNTAFASYRGGTGLNWGNTATTSNGGFFNSIISFSVYRTVFTAQGGWGACGNASSGSAAGPFDDNDGTTYYSGTMTSGTNGETMYDSTKSWGTNQLAPAGAPYSVFDVTQGFVAQIASNTANSITLQQSIPEQPNNFNAGDSYQIRRSKACVDQGGRGQGLLVQATTPVLQSRGTAGPLNEVLDPVYEWDDTVANLLHGDVGFNDAGQILANRDYYTDNSNGSPVQQTSPTSAFNGTSGIGRGTLSNRPTTCTTGVAYWATDQGNWNQSGSGGQGKLFKCTAPNIWTMSYQPYTYPHPLTTGATTTDPNAPTQPTNLTGTVH